MARLFSFFALIALPALSWAQSIPAMTWGLSGNVSNTSGRPSSFPKVAATGDTVHAIWWDNDSWAQPGSAYYKRSLDGGATWQDLHVLSTALLASSAEIVASGSKIVAFWSEQQSSQYIIRYARSADAGVTWSAPQDISPSLSTVVSFVRADAGSGQVVVFWAEVSGSAASLKVRISTDDGQTWGSTLNVPTFNFDPNEGLSADVAIAGSAIVVGYIESPFAVRTVRSTDGGQTWSSPALVSSDPSHPLHTLHLAAYGSVVVARWGRFFGTYNTEAMAASSADGGENWSTSTSLSSGLAGDNTGGDVCIWGNRAVAIWTNNPAGGATDFPLYYRRSLDGGQTWEPATIIPTALYRFDVPRCTTTPNSLYIVGYAGSGSTDIYLFRGQAWGPDLEISGKIGFTSTRDGNAEVYVMNADGTGQTRLTNTSAPEYQPSWSPDGSKIAFNSLRDGNSEIYVMNADGTGQTNLTNNSADDGSQGWSPDGNKIAFGTNRDGNSEIYVMNADGTGLTRLTNNSASDGAPRWSPDGSKIAFKTDRDGNDEIYVMNADGTNQTRLTNNSAWDAYPDWSPDGSKIVFESARDGTWEIYVMNADGTGQTRLTNNTTTEEVPSWSPDGSKIAFRDGRHGNTQIYVMNADGTGQTRLTNNSAVEAYPSWGESIRRIGSTTVGTPVSRTLTIKNRGDATLNVTNITSSDAQFTLSPTSFSLAPGSSQNVTVTFTPTSAGVKYSTLTITSNDQDSPTAKLMVNGTATGTPILSLSATSVAAGNVNVGSSGTATFTVGNTGSAALSVTGITVGGTDASQFTVSPSSFTVNAGAAAQTVTVTFVSTSAGPKSASLSIAHSATGSPSTVSLSGTGAQPPAPAFYTSLTSWTKYAANPVLNVSPGQFDAAYLYSPMVLYDGIYRMWYVGYPGSGVNHRIGYATSADGLTWTKYGMVLDVGSGWEQQSIHAPSVIKDGGLYKMWYSGHGGAGGQMDIGYATSADGQTWTKYAGNPVFMGSSFGSSTELYVGTVLKEGTTYKMWYGATPPATAFHLRYATSADGITWTDSGQILGAGSSGAWDESLGAYCNVLKKGELYEMWYEGTRAGVNAIGYATSADGITWTKSPYNPVLSKGSAGSWEGNHVADPAVLLEGETHKMWYKGYDGSLNRIGYATGGSATASAVLSFGNVNLGSSGTQTFTVANAGNAALTISNITLSGTDASQFSVSPTSFTINPGGAAQTVTVTFAPTSSGSKSATLSIAHNAPGSPATVSLTGTATGGPDLQISGKIAFRSNMDGNYESYTMNPDGTGVTRLTNNPAEDWPPSLSPDSTKVAFSSNRDGNWEVYVMNVDGSNLVRLTNNPAKDWYPSWSPEGTKISFESNRDGSFEIYVMGTDGSNQTRLTNNAATDMMSAWSPDGMKIAFTSNRDGNWDVYMMNADGSNSTRITSNPADDWEAIWSPDGTKIAFSTYRNGNWDVYVMNADGSSSTQLTSNSASEQYPIWSPDGTKIYFQSGRDGNYELYVMNVDGSNQTRTTNNSAEDCPFSWTPFQRIGATAIGSSTSRTLTIENKGTASLNVTNITSSDGQFTISPTSFSVATGASQNVTVTFTPTSVGVKYSTLTISSNDADAPTAKLMVNGTGQGPVISLSATSLSLGSVNKGSSGTTTFAVSNTGSGVLSVSNITSSTAQFAASPTSFNLAAGASQTVTVTFAPTSGTPQGAIQSGALTLTHNAAPTATSSAVSVSGTAIDPAPATPAGLAATAGNGQATLTWTANTESDLSHYVIYRSTTTNFTPTTADSIARVNKPTTTFTNTSLTTGTYYFKLAAVDSAGNKSAFSIQGSAIIEPHIAVSPTALNFGNVRTGTTRIQTFAVSNTGTDTLKVSALPLSGTDAGRFTCSPSSFSVAPGAVAQVVSVTFSPMVGSQSATPKSAVLSFTDNAPETPQLSLSGIATAPAIALSPSPLDFGSVTIGQSATSLLTVANTGTDTLLVSSLALSGSNANQFPLAAGQGNPLYTIAPNASQVVSVPFTPTAAGSKSATLTLTHNAAPTATSTAVTLSGTGSSIPVPTLSPNPLAFGNVKVGQNKLLTLTVTNNSSAALSVVTVTSSDPVFAVSPASFTVPANGGSQLVIGLTPPDRAVRTATLTLTYATGSGPASVTATLTGQGTQPVIAVPDSLRFGDVNIETEQRRTLPLTIHNTGNDTLVLSEIIRPTGVFSVTPTVPPVLSLRGGDSTRVNVTFAPTSTRVDTASLTIRSNAANAPTVRLGLSGRGTLVGFVVRPDTLDFGRVRVDSAATRTLTVANPGSLPLAIDSTASSSPRFSAQPRTFTVNGGDSARVAVSFAPVQKGVEAGTLTLSGNAQPKRVVIRGIGVRPELAVFPDSLDFLEVVMPDTGVLPLLVSNAGNDTLRVTRINRDNLRFTLSDSVFALPPDSAKSVAVRFAPTQPGRVELGRLVLATNAGNREVRVRGRGIEYDWTVSPSPLEFGRVRVDSSRSRTVSIVNRGQARVRIDSFVVVGGERIVELVRLDLPPSIAGGTTVEVATLRFAPRTAGQLSGVALRVKSGEAVRSDSIMGEGIAPPDMAVTPDSLVLGPVALGGAKTGTLEIRNTGGDTLHLSQLRSDQEVFSAVPATLILAPGASGTVNISFRPVAASEEPVQSRLLFASDDPSPPQIKLSGSVTPLPAVLSYAPADTLRFGVVSPGWSELQPLVIRNRGRGTLKAVLRSESGEFAPEQGDTLRIAAQDSVQALIRFTPARPGYRYGNLLISSNDRQIPLASLVMWGEGGGPRLEPPAIDFGEVVVGSRVDTAIQVINQSAGQWTISLSVTGLGFGINPTALRLEPKTSGRVQVWFRPPVEGDDYSGKIEVRGQPLLNVILSGTGAEGPDIEVSPSRDFGEVAVGQVGVGTLTVWNKGRGPLKVFDLSSSRLEYRVAQADSLPLIIPPGEDHSLQVSFTPDTTGEVSGSLTILSNDPDEQEVVRLLNGQGRLGLRPPPPCIAVTTGEQEEEFYFGRLEAGEERELPLVVRNDCQGVLRVERIEADSRQVTADPESLVVAAGESRRVGMRLRAELGEAQEGVVRLVSNDPDHPVVRRRWYYTPERPCAEVLTEQLRFGPAEEGQRAALLAISNPCSARLLVYLVDEERQLTFAEERLVVEPEQLERVWVSYAGSGGSGQVVLATNDPAQRKLTIPWEAQTPLQVRSALPKEGATGVSRQTTAQLEFDQALRQVGKGLASVQLHILPEPLNNWRRQVQVEGYILSIPLELATGTSYRLVVVDAEAQSGARLTAPFELHFSTAAQALAVGSIAGRVLFDDGSSVVGTVFLANMQKELMGSARIVQDGSYTLNKVPEGRYQLFAQEKATGLSIAYEQEVEVGAGQTMNGIDLVLPAQQPIEEKVVVLNGEVIIEEAPELLADSTFAVPIHTKGVQDLSGFAIQVSFNPEDVALVEVRPNSPTEKNVLYSTGGFPMFLSLVRDAGNMEFGGSLLGPQASQAPDGDGLLAYFVFRALRDPTEVEVVQVRRRTLRGEDVVSGGTVRPTRCLAADFDCSGAVDFDDFFHFADHFGKPAQGETAHCDMDKDGTVDFSDFFIFADDFGKTGGSVAKLLALARELLGLPEVADLSPAYPNPFNAQTTIGYQLPEKARVQLVIYDLLGQQVRTLMDQTQEGGSYRVVWDGRDIAGNAVASGVYFYRLEAGPFHAVRKLLLLR